MNVSRKCADGSTHPEEQLNKSQLYITTAGYKNTFPYNKLIQFLVWQIVRPEKAMIMGGTYRIPVLVKLLDKNFVNDLRMDGTFNESSFEREYKRFVLFKYCELRETPNVKTRAIRSQASYFKRKVQRLHGISAMLSAILH